MCRAAKIFTSLSIVLRRQTQKFRSYLLSLGIDDPVTRETHGSGDAYLRELARQISDFIHQPLQVAELALTVVVLNVSFPSVTFDSVDWMTGWTCKP